MIISLIAAMDLDRAIGYKNNLMWHLPDDFKWFKEKTKGKPMVMGRNTMVSLKKALPGRLNIVVSSKNEDLLEGFIYADSIDNAMKLLPAETEEVMIVGGGQIYTQMLANADRLYITRVNYVWPDADTFFPLWKDEEWKITYSEHHSTDERHAYSFDFVILDRNYKISKT